MAAAGFEVHMPRLLPRLLAQLAKTSLEEVKPKIIPPASSRKKRRSLRIPIPSFPSFSLFERTQSILLDAHNPVINAKEHVRHKSLRPRVNLGSNFQRRQRSKFGEIDVSRAMTKEESRRWSSPYLRMLSSPMRRCLMTQSYLPSDFLLRMAPFRIQRLETSIYHASFLPDGLEHPKFKDRKSGTGNYVLCRKTAVKQLTERGTYKRVAQNVSMHPVILEHIGHLLRLRVLQELEILADRLQARPQGASDITVLRKLSRAEWHAVKTTGTIPLEDAAALLVVPPLNNNPVTKTRPKANLSSEYGVSESDSGSLHPFPPSSVLYPSDVSASPERDDTFLHIPSSQIPLYNGLSLFPDRSQRAALYAALSRLLSVERRARFQERRRFLRAERAKSEPLTPPDRLARDDQKASHTYLFCSDANVVRRADTAPVAIALWRLRMWEGVPWDETPE